MDLEMFKEGLRRMGVIMAPQDVTKVFAACDRNGDGQLDVEARRTFARSHDFQGFYSDRAMLQGRLGVR